MERQSSFWFGSWVHGKKEGWFLFFLARRKNGARRLKTQGRESGQREKVTRVCFFLFSTGSFQSRGQEGAGPYEKHQKKRKEKGENLELGLRDRKVEEKKKNTANRHEGLEGGGLLSSRRRVMIFLLRGERDTGRGELEGSVSYLLMG